MKKTFKIIFFVSFFCSMNFFATAFAQEKTSVMNVSNFNMLFSGNPKWGEWSDNKNFNGHLYEWWQERKPRIVSVIRFHEMDIVGSQELMPFQIDELLNLLGEFKVVGTPDRTLHNVSEYMHLGAKRAGFEVVHSMMYNAIFYKHERFELLENGIFALSATPDDLASMGWDKEKGQRRTCVWGKLREKKTGLIFYFFNTHLNHITQGEVDKSCDLILKKIKEINSENAPFILTGDFNVEMNNAGLDGLLKSGLMNEAYQISDLPPHGATNSNPNECERKRIDHIFVSKNIGVFKYGTLTDHVTTNEKKGNYYKGAMRYPSDHYPVLTKISIPLNSK